MEDENLKFLKSSKPQKFQKDNSFKKTTGKVLDTKTLKILESLQKRNLISDFGGCFSSGKEANVYLASCEDKKALQSKFLAQDLKESFSEFVAIKIYRTSTMEFRKRESYLEDEKRFKSFCCTNSRKLIRLWAEKEIRNLNRLIKADIPAPKALYLKRNILIMEMIGDSNGPAKRLKQVKTEELKELNLSFENLYDQCLNLLNEMYHKAKLVHSDFSEYNLLFFEGKVFVIDVGQSVEPSHPNSDRFLISDIRNINEFFKKKQIENLRTVNEIFEKITNKIIPEFMENVELNKTAFIPDRLDEVKDVKEIETYLSQNQVEKEKKESKKEEKFCNRRSTREEILERRKTLKQERKIKRMSKNDTKTASKGKKSAKKPPKIIKF